jgi:hypothetical protein
MVTATCGPWPRALAVNLRISSLRKKSRKMNYPPSQTFNCGWDTLAPADEST